MSALHATATPPRPLEARGPRRSTGQGPTSTLLRDLLAGPPVSDLEQRALVRDAQDGTAAQIMLDLDLAPGAAQREALSGRRDRGLRARRRLLEAALGRIVEIAERRTSAATGDSLVHLALAHVAAAIGRYDADREPSAFLDWVAGPVNEALAAAGSVEDEPGTGAAGDEIVAAVRARAALIGSPLTDEEVEVLSLRFGDKRRGGMSLTEAGKSLGLTRFDVRRVEARAIARLRRHPSTQTSRR